MDTLKSANTGEDEVELAAKVDRMQSTALLALTHMLELPPTSPDQPETQLEGLVGATRLWKLAKSPSSAVAVRQCGKHMNNSYEYFYPSFVFISSAIESARQCRLQWRWPSIGQSSPRPISRSCSMQCLGEEIHCILR